MASEPVAVSGMHPGVPGGPAAPPWFSLSARMEQP